MRAAHCLLGLVLVACSSAGMVVVSGPEAAPTAVRPVSDGTSWPPAAREYVSQARPGGVVGGPRAVLLADEIAAALRARGDRAEADGALVAVAAWLFRQSTAQERQQGAGAIAPRLGFMGVVRTAAAFPPDGDGPPIWRAALADVAGNLPINRYGVLLSPDGRQVVVVFGSVEVSLAAFPRHFRPGEICKLRGETARRYDRAQLFVTSPDGKVAETRFPGRKIDLAVRLPVSGVYRLEVMGDGPRGPAVLMNVPIYAGGASDEGEMDRAAAPSAAADVPRADRSRTLDVAGAEARMLALLNAARVQARLAPVAGDPELRSVALAHTRDMIDAHFIGHVSPTTGNVEARLQRAGVVLSMSGENVVQADSPDGAHDALMDSPAHRANMLRARFTHVGIGVAFRPGEPRDLVATLVFGRRPAPPPTPMNGAVAAAFISSMRRARGAAPIATDPVLQAAAEAGLAALMGGGGGGTAAVSPDQAMAVAHQALARESQRLRLGRRSVCTELVEMLELDELEQDSLLAQPRLGKVGLAAAATRAAPGKPPKIFVLVLAEGATCK